VTAGQRRQAITEAILLAVTLAVGGLAIWFTATGFTPLKTAALVAAVVAGLVVDSRTVLWLWKAGQ
jgi:zinc transporter ZupT